MCWRKVIATVFGVNLRELVGTSVESRAESFLPDCGFEVTYDRIMIGKSNKIGR